MEIYAIEQWDKNELIWYGLYATLELAQTKEKDMRKELGEDKVFIVPKKVREEEDGTTNNATTF